MVKVSSSFIKSFMENSFLKGTHIVIAYAQDLWIVVEIPFDFHSQMIKKGNLSLSHNILIFIDCDFPSP